MHSKIDPSYKNSYVARNPIGVTRSDKITITYVLIVIVLAVIMLFWITPYGAGASPDSVAYIKAAENILTGRGYLLNGQSLSWFPPLYSMLLAALGFLFRNILQGAHALNAVLYGINIGILAWLVYLSTGRSLLATVISTLFFISSAQFLELHAMAWSEPVFITFSLLCISLLSGYAIKPRRWLLIGSALSLGLACLSRYIGIAFIPAALIIILWIERKKQLSRRIFNAFIYFIFAFLPLGAFLIRNIIASGALTGRLLSIHTISLSNFTRTIIASVLTFIAPVSLAMQIRLAIIAIIGVIFIVALVMFIRRQINTLNWNSFHIVVTICCIVFSISYIIFLYISISFFDASTLIDIRLLSPILVLMIFGTFSIACTIFIGINRPWLWYGFLFLVVLSILAKTPQTVRLANSIQKEGLGYTSLQWQRSESVAYINSLPENLKIYTNGQDVLGLLTQSNPVMLPEKWDPATKQKNLNYHNEITKMCSDIKDGNGLLAYLSTITSREYFPSQTELLDQCDLPIKIILNDGTIYGR